MSIARKRAKVKKNSPAVKKKRRKAKGSSKAPPAKKKRRPAKPAKRKPPKKKPTAKRPRPARPTKRIGSLQLSVNTKPPRGPKTKLKKRKAKRKKKKLSPEQLDELIQRTIAKAAQQAGVSELEIRVRAAGGTFEQLKDAAFFARPDVKLQVAERMIETGLMDLTKGMVRTSESLILAEMILAEQRGNLTERAKQLSEEFGIPLKEVWTIFKSPDSIMDA